MVGELRNGMGWDLLDDLFSSDHIIFSLLLIRLIVVNTYLCFQIIYHRVFKLLITEEDGERTLEWDGIVRWSSPNRTTIVSVWPSVGIYSIYYINRGTRSQIINHRGRWWENSGMGWDLLDDHPRKRTTTISTWPSIGIYELFIISVEGEGEGQGEGDRERVRGRERERTRERERARERAKERGRVWEGVAEREGESEGDGERER
jgi:hypothetical protein